MTVMYVPNKRIVSSLIDFEFSSQFDKFRVPRAAVVCVWRALWRWTLSPPARRTGDQSGLEKLRQGHPVLRVPGGRAAHSVHTDEIEQTYSPRRI